MNQNNIITLGPRTIVFVMTLATVLAFMIGLHIGILFAIGSVGYTAYIFDEYTKKKQEVRNETKVS